MSWTTNLLNSRKIINLWSRTSSILQSGLRSRKGKRPSWGSRKFRIPELNSERKKMTYTGKTMSWRQTSPETKSNLKDFSIGEISFRINKDFSERNLSIVRTSTRSWIKLRESLSTNSEISRLKLRKRKKGWENISFKMKCWSSINLYTAIYPKLQREKHSS